jgi:hypothetical protein
VPLSNVATAEGYAATFSWREYICGSDLAGAGQVLADNGAVGVEISLHVVMASGAAQTIQPMLAGVARDILISNPYRSPCFTIKSTGSDTNDPGCPPGAARDRGVPARYILCLSSLLVATVPFLETKITSPFWAVLYGLNTGSASRGRRGHSPLFVLAGGSPKKYTGGRG